MTSAEELAREFEAAQDQFIALVESLSDEDWRAIGRNHPQRMNDEDEGRPVGVIAHHVAVDGPWVMARIQDTLAGRQLVAPDKKAVNAKHAQEHAGAGREEVLALLRESKPEIAAAVRSIPDDQLDIPHDTPVGPMTLAFRVQAVLIGHIKAHQGSIEAAIGA